MISLHFSEDLGPRGSKGEVVKIKRNSLEARGQRDCEESR